MGEEEEVAAVAAAGGVVLAVMALASGWSRKTELHTGGTKERRRVSLGRLPGLGVLRGGQIATAGMQAQHQSDPTRYIFLKHAPTTAGAPPLSVRAVVSRRDGDWLRSVRTVTP